MKKTYEFETEPIVHYSVRVLDGAIQKQGSPWVCGTADLKNICEMLMQNGVLAKIVKRTTFVENYISDEYRALLETYITDTAKRIEDTKRVLECMEKTKTR